MIRILQKNIMQKVECNSQKLVKSIYHMLQTSYGILQQVQQMLEIAPIFQIIIL